MVQWVAVGGVVLSLCVAQAGQSTQAARPGRTEAEARERAEANRRAREEQRVKSGAPPELIADYVKANIGPVPEALALNPFYKKYSDAMGIPVVASDVGGTSEALGMADRVRGAEAPGLLVAPGDVDALAAALRLWLSDADARRRLRAAARERRDDLPSWDATVVAVHDALGSTALVGAQR